MDQTSYINLIIVIGSLLCSGMHHRMSYVAFLAGKRIKGASHARSAAVWHVLAFVLAGVELIRLLIK